jgi:hypothetical protein
VAISEHAQSFAGLPIRDYDPTRGIQNPTRVIYRIFQDYESEIPFSEQLEKFLADPAAEQVHGIVIGMWAEDPGAGSESIVKTLADAKNTLRSLKAIFLGDITYEECEISWIEQSDVSPLLKAYPKLEHFRVRGAAKLSLGKLNHSHLRSLVVEAGGLPKAVVHEVGAARLPALEHLELWLGDDGYGADATVDDLRPILDGQLFPKLRYLGLRDSCIADQVAAAVALAPVLHEVRVLDLSLGTLGNEGAEALLASPAVARLEKLDIHHHYVSNELVKKLKGLGIIVDASEVQKPDTWDNEEHRYVAVGE